MNTHIPDGTPSDEYPDVPTGPGEPGRSVNWSSAEPDDIIDEDPHPDGPPPPPIYY